MDWLLASMAHTLSPSFASLHEQYPDLKQLDLTFLSQKLILLSQVWLHRSEKKSHRNNIHQVADFLYSKYEDNFLIFNLSSHEQDLMTRKFSRKVVHVVNKRHPWPIALEYLVQLCHAILAWIKISQDHVIVLHCPNGLEKSCLIAACLFKMTEAFPSTFEAFDYCIAQRKLSMKEYEPPRPMIRRYLHYYHDLFLLNDHFPNPEPRKLRQVIINPVPNFDGKGDCTPGIEIYQNSKLAFTSLLSNESISKGILLDSVSDDEYKLTDELDFLDLVSDAPINFTGTFKDPSYIIFQFKEPLNLFGNVFIRVFHYNRKADTLVTMFTYYFHTGWTHPGVHRCRLKDLEIPLKDLEPIKLGNYSHSRFTQDFSVDFVLTPELACR